MPSNIEEEQQCYVLFFLSTIISNAQTVNDIVDAAKICDHIARDISILVNTIGEGNLEF